MNIYYDFNLTYLFGVLTIKLKNKSPLTTLLTNLTIKIEFRLISFHRFRGLK